MDDEEGEQEIEESIEPAPKIQKLEDTPEKLVKELEDVK